MARDLSQFIEELRFEIGRDQVDQRLDLFLCDQVFWRSRSDLQDRIKRGTVLVDGRRSKPSAKLRLGSIVRLLVEPEDLPDQDPASISLTVLAEDDDIIVVDKQAGLVVHPTGSYVYDTLMNALHWRYRQSGELERGVFPHVVHRLDRNTSGVLVVAKTFAAKKNLAEQFLDRVPQKTYIAIVEGLVKADDGTIDAALMRDDGAAIRLMMKVDAAGLPSRSRFRVLERFASHSLVEVRPETGRQHQIRVHLAHIGHAIVADPLYGDPRSVAPVGLAKPLLDRQALHAAELVFRHPRSGASTTARAALPADMQRVLEALRDGHELRHGVDSQSSRWS